MMMLQNNFGLLEYTRSSSLKYLASGNMNFLTADTTSLVAFFVPCLVFNSIFTGLYLRRLEHVVVHHGLLDLIVLVLRGVESAQA